MKMKNSFKILKYCTFILLVYLLFSTSTWYLTRYHNSFGKISNFKNLFKIKQSDFKASLYFVKDFKTNQCKYFVLGKDHTILGSSSWE